MKKISKCNKLYERRETMVIFQVIFAGIASKLENVGPAFSGFNPPNPSLPFLTTDRKRIQCLKIILKKTKKTGPLYVEFN